jgi:hypothetical protein
VGIGTHYGSFHITGSFEKGSGASSPIGSSCRSVQLNTVNTRPKTIDLLIIFFIFFIFLADYHDLKTDV